VPWELFIDETDPTKFHVNVSGRRIVDDSSPYGEERSGTDMLRQRMTITDEVALMVLYSDQRDVAAARVMYDGNVTLPDVPVVKAGDGWYLVVASARGFDNDFVGVHLLDADGRVVGVRAGLAESTW
jgi:hypothetical protein